VGLVVMLQGKLEFRVLEALRLQCCNKQTTFDTGSKCFWDCGGAGPG
jgi:hypothetical protein